jgi:hypothetical protein
MDKANQMEFLFEEGGMADDGLDRDPVSGNEVPSGSMSEEVRDDIPAQLSEGEYVVPADVVRYFGVKYFEDLRDDAKMGLTQMEQEGRIGGEPVDMEGDDTDLTPEEMAELDAIMGMAMGGSVSTTYDRIAPQPVGNIAQQQQLDGMEEQMTRAFQEGGDVLPEGTQLSPDFSGFGAGFTFGNTPVGSLYPTPTVEPIRTVTLYSPEGASLPFNLPTQQADYDSYIAQGWTTQPPAAPVATAPVQQPSGDDNDDTPIDYNRSLNQGMTGSRQFSLGDIDQIRNDPVGYATSQLQRDTTGSRIAGGIVSVLGGPFGAIGGGALAVAGDVEPIANARAAIIEMQRQNTRTPGRYTAEQIEGIQSGITSRIAELPLASRLALGTGSIGTGERYGNQIARAVDKIDNIYAFNSTRPSYLGEMNGFTVLENVGKAAASLQGRAAQDYAETVERNNRVSEDKVRTGSAAGDVAVGNISGVDGVAGVVVDPDTGKVFRDPNDKKTVFRDNEGRTYVRTGLLGNSIEYRDVEGVPASGTPPPQNTQGVDTGNNDNDKGEGSVICTALFNKGLLSKEIFMLDTQYGLMLESSQPEVTYGYRKMATPLATYIQKDTLGATITRTLVAPVAKAWASEMAHQMQPETYKGNLLGKAIIKLGYPVCAFVGKRSKEIVYGT